jgi:predicted MFS family arabinose efflux permease
MPFFLPVLALAAFTSALSLRALDPILPQIANALAITIQTAALASSAAAIANALSQPALGIFSDVLGKTRVMSVCLLLIAVGNFATALAPSFELLLAGRVLCGIGFGGIMPVAMSLVGDMVPIPQRQIAMSRVTAGAMSGFLLGASLSGIISEFVGWRAVFLVGGCAVILAAAAYAWSFRNMEPPPPRKVDVDFILRTYGAILRHPHTRICFTTVFFEGMCFHGLFPFVSTLLADAGQTRPAVAGFVLAGFPVGVLIYTASISRMLPILQEKWLMLLGGIVGGSQLLALAFSPPWELYFLCMIVMGFGFFMLHGCMHSFVSEIAPQARGAAVSLHAVCVFTGGSIGPIFYGYGFEYFGKATVLTIAATIAVVAGAICSRLLRHKKAEA